MEKEKKDILKEIALNGSGPVPGIDKILDEYSADKLPFQWVDGVLDILKEIFEEKWGDKISFLIRRIDFKFDPDANTMSKKEENKAIRWRFILCPKTSNNREDMRDLFNLKILINRANSEQWSLSLSPWNDASYAVSLKSQDKYDTGLMAHILRALNNGQFVSFINDTLALENFISK